MTIKRIFYKEFDIPYEVSDLIWNICRKERAHKVARKKQDMHIELLGITKGIYYGLALNYKKIISDHWCKHGAHWYMLNDSMLDNSTYDNEVYLSLSMLDHHLFINNYNKGLAHCVLYRDETENILHVISRIQCTIRCSNFRTTSYTSVSKIMGKYIDKITTEDIISDNDS